MSNFSSEIEPVTRYMNRHEMLVYFNRRGMRPGIIGTALDGASGKELDRAATIFDLTRGRAELWGFKLPWSQRDETLRSRIWLKFQADNYNPNDTSVRLYP